MRLINSFLAELTAAKSVLLAAATLLTVSVAGAQSTVAEWQAKAVQEYPTLGTADSELNIKFRNKVAELKKINPAYFNDPRWPYTLVISLDPKTQIIPGLETVDAFPTSQAAPSAPAFTLKRVEGQTNKLPVYTGSSLSEVFSKGSRTLPVGQMICVQGIVNRSVIDTLRDPKKFFVVLDPNILCEFTTDGFIETNQRYVTGAFSGGPFKYDVRFKDGQVMLYSARTHDSRDGSPAQFKPVRAILGPAENISVVGRLEGPGQIETSTKGLILRDCSIHRIIGD